MSVDGYGFSGQERILKFLWQKECRKELCMDKEI